MKKTVVISLGGSIVVPDKLDIRFLKEFNRLIRSNLRKYRFVIIVGGGKTARNYINAADKVGHIDNEDKDWIGIHATRLNAHLLRTIFRDIAYPVILKNPTRKVRFDKVLVAAGWKPGWSTDYDAVLLAKTLGARTVINMTNIDYLHDKDPNKYKGAKKIEKTNWHVLRNIVGDKWKPGLNVPFDPIATKKAQKLGLRLVLVGKNLKNLKNFLDGKKFKGSIVEG